MIDTLGLWHKIIETGDTTQLAALLADHAVLISPVVHTHQKGKTITQLYLTAAFQVLVNEDFKYVRETHDDDGVIMEFETVIDGVFVNGVDMVKWDKQGLITEFKVMVRPLQAVNLLHTKMGELLQQMKNPKNDS